MPNKHRFASENKIIKLMIDTAVIFWRRQCHDWRSVKQEGVNDMVDAIQCSNEDCESGHKKYAKFCNGGEP
jgi:hypothetical protein